MRDHGKSITGALFGLIGAVFITSGYTDRATGLKKGEKPRKPRPRLDTKGALKDPPTSKRAKRRARGRERHA